MSKLKSKYYIEAESRDSMNDDNSSGSEQADSDVIRCICDDTSDDGFTIQCEKCEDWQHASCVNIKKNRIPDHYVCERCNKKQKRLSNDIRRQFVLDTDFNDKKKKRLLKRPQKRVYNEGSDENNEQYSPQNEFTHLPKSKFREKLVEDLLIEVHRQWIESNRPKSTNGKQEQKMPLNKRLESIVVMESNLLSPDIPKASIKPIRKSLRGSYYQNQNDLSVEKGLFADIHIPEQRYLMEVTGELLRKSEYKNNPENNFSLLGVPLAHVFFYPFIDICIDARCSGNDTRFIRRSCRPNSEIKSIILPNDNDNLTIHMGIYTSEEVSRGDEITIGWNWHRNLLMWHKHKEFLRRGYKVDIDLSERKTVKKILRLLTDEYGECACEDKDDCLIECLKDELDKTGGAEDDSSGSNTKKKRLNTTTKSRSSEKKAEPKKPRASDIFSSDEEGNSNDSRRSSIKENKLIFNKNTTKKKPVPIPSSPAVSVTDSVEIDIVSTSPAPGEGEPETHTVGSKRARLIPMSDIQLPCKKRWLRQYLLQQLKAKAEQPSVSKSQDPHDKPQLSCTDKEESPAVSIPPRPAENDEEDGSIDVEGELSDCASSESTLPLEDTPTIAHNEPVNTNIKTEVDTTKSKQENDTSVIGTEIPEQSLELEDTIMEEAQADLSTEVQILQSPAVKEDTQPASPMMIEDMQIESMAKIEDTNHNQPQMTEAKAIDESLTECDQNHEDQCSTKTEDTKPAPRKLTLQEYLSLRRGNLPTPGETSL